jgi:hypothetical protein
MPRFLFTLGENICTVYTSKNSDPDRFPSKIIKYKDVSAESGIGAGEMFSLVWHLCTHHGAYTFTLVTIRPSCPWLGYLRLYSILYNAPWHI